MRKKLRKETFDERDSSISYHIISFVSFGEKAHRRARKPLRLPEAFQHQRQNLWRTEK
jgi:hypothetical protein